MNLLSLFQFTLFKKLYTLKLPIWIILLSYFLSGSTESEYLLWASLLGTYPAPRVPPLLNISLLDFLIQRYSHPTAMLSAFEPLSSPMRAGMRCRWTLRFIVLGSNVEQKSRPSKWDICRICHLQSNSLMCICIRDSSGRKLQLTQKHFYIPIERGKIFHPGAALTTKTCKKNRTLNFSIFRHSVTYLLSHNSFR